MSHTGMILAPIGSKYPSALEIDRLERELKAAREEISSLRQALTDNVNESAEFHRGLNEFRDSVRPMFDGLCRVFGQLDRIPGGDQPSSSNVDSRVTAVWESWKQRLGEGPAKVIDALLLHREMNTQQLAIATGYHRTTVPAFVHKLTKAGLINKNSGRFSLKEL